jgi:anti-anti-sigma regulatory factor
MIVTPTIFADSESGPAVWIRVEGRGTFVNSPALKEFSRRMIEAGRRDFVVDLQNCPSMDSTFMGTLAAVALRIRDAGGGNLWVVNRNERNAGALAGLGMDTLFSGEPPPAGVNGGNVEAIRHEADKAATRQTMHEAHEACIVANPANAGRFKDVLDELKSSAARAAKG